MFAAGSGKTAAFLVPVLARLFTTGQRAEDREREAMVSDYPRGFITLAPRVHSHKLSGESEWGVKISH